jgi:Coenzyme PQQ synthesis protein D (PqqD)
MSSSEQSNERLLASKGSIPEHVVFRAFAQETVVLNLLTGKYHGLDPVGGRLIELLPRAATLRAAALQIAEEYNRPVEEVEADVVEFCRDLQERGLVDFGANGHH